MLGRFAHAARRRSYATRMAGVARESTSGRARIARAFEPFRQIEEGLNRPHNGLGLGLYLARGILRLHGGEVKLVSLAGAGTEARLSLPAERVNWKAPFAPHDFTRVQNVA